MIQMVSAFHLPVSSSMPNVHHIVKTRKAKRRIQYSPENLRLFRYKYCISQGALSSILDINQTAISQWELNRSRPDESHIREIERLLNLGENEIHSILSVKAPKCLDDMNRFKLTNETVRQFCKKNSISLGGLACLLGIYENTVEHWGRGQYPSAEHYKALTHLMDLPKEELKAKIESLVPKRFRIQRKDKKQVREYLIRVRKKYRINQKELALLINVCVASIAHWESGRCYPSEEYLAAVKKLARLSKRRVDSMLFEKKLAKLFNSKESIVIPAPAAASEKTISINPAKV